MAERIPVLRSRKPRRSSPFQQAHERRPVPSSAESVALVAKPQIAVPPSDRPARDT